ncbi:MAG TPA: hypothetical protein VGY58_05320 [Gemmataceae bacterium]|jgi:hypothetical protein|nr:hypothetical protein [Gemmataceae bacterium]
MRPRYDMLITGCLFPLGNVLLAFLLGTTLQHPIVGMALLSIVFAALTLWVIARLRQAKNRDERLRKRARA